MLTALECFWRPPGVSQPPGIPFTRRAHLCQTGAPPRAWPAPGAAAARSRLRRIAPIARSVRAVNRADRARRRPDA